MIDNPISEQLKRAEKLLATIQHQRIGVPEEVKREIRNYFSEDVRGQAINWSPEGR
jgi:hypothetical protein